MTVTALSGQSTRAGAILVALVTLLALGALAPAAHSIGPREGAAVALHPWRLETRSYAPLWPLRDPALRERTFSRLEAAGVRRARVDLKWSSVEWHSGNALLRDWGEFDAIVASARRHGVQLEPMVAFTPRWASLSHDPFSYPLNPARFESFMAAAMDRYPDIRAWEIWNEVNWSRFSPPRPEAASVVRLLRAAHAARARVRSRAKIIVGGLTPAGEVAIPDFAVQLARLGAFRYADGLGVHPYSRRRPEVPGSSFLELPKLHARVAREAGRRVDLWVTEYGFPDATAPSSYGPAASDREQSIRMGRAYALAAGWPWLKRLTWYGFRDDCSISHKPDCRFGLLREDFTAKRSWHTFRDVLAGHLPRLATRVSLRRRSKRVGRRGRRRRVHRLGGGLFTPGTEPSRGTIRVTAVRRYRGRRRVRRYRARLRNGRYDVFLGRLRRGRWRFRADFWGDRRYAPSHSRALRLRVRR
jgi:polysaccharide biosynthesis protein PslG